MALEVYGGQGVGGPAAVRSRLAPRSRSGRRNDTTPGSRLVSLTGLSSRMPTPNARPGPAGGRGRVIRRRRLTVAAVLVGVAIVVTVLLLPAQRGGPAAARRAATAPGPAPTGPTSTSGPTSTTAATSGATVPQPPFPVGSTTVEVTDGARVLPTVVRYPALRAGPGAPAQRNGGPWPLIVFSQGYAISPESYSDLLEAWAASGFVVADPAYPDTTPGDPGGLDEDDIVDHPADLRAVIADLVASTSATSTHPVVAGLVTSGALGLAGHSDGGDVTDAFVAGPCCKDVHVTAAAVLSGAELTSLGSSFAVPPSVPLLVTQGDLDTINAPACSAEIYDSAAGTRYYLDLLGAGHHSPYLDPSAMSGYPGAGSPDASGYRALVRDVTIAFWQRYLSPHPAGPDAIAAAAGGAAAGLARLTVASPVPVVGACPGAPAP